MRTLCVWVLVGLGFAGCHVVFPHTPSEGGAADGPRVERTATDGRADLLVDGRARDRGAEAPRRDAATDAPRDRSPDAKQADLHPVDQPVLPDGPPPPVLGAPCGDGKTGPGCCSSSKWCWQSPLPQGNDLKAAWALAPDDVYLVGERGTILHWYKGVFYKETSGTTARLNAVWGTSSPRTLFAVGGNGTILRRDASSASWSSEPGTTTQLNAVFGLGVNEVYAVGNNGTVYKRDPNTSWALQSWSIPTTATLQAVWASGTVVYVGGFVTSGPQQARLWSRSTSTKTTTPEIVANGALSTTVAGIWGHGASVLAVGNNLIRQKTATMWSSSSVSEAFSSTWHDGTDYWVVGSKALHRLSSLAVSHAQGAGLVAVHGSGATGVAVGNRGAVWRYEGAWTQKSTHLTTGDLNGIWGSSSSDLWSASSSGEILRFDGSTWKIFHAYSTTTFPGNLAYAAISGFATPWKTTKVAVGASEGTSTHTSSHLADLLPPSFAGSTPALTGVWVESDNKAHATAATGIFSWNGVAWSSASGAGTSWLLGIWGFADGTLVAVGPSLSCTKLSTSGWSCTAHSGSALRAVWGFEVGGAQKTVIAVGDDRIATQTGGGWMNTSFSPGTTPLRAIWGRGNNERYAVGGKIGGYGVVLRYAGSPPTWTPEESGTHKQLNGVYLPPLASGCDAWAVGDTGTILCRLP